MRAVRTIAAIAAALSILAVALPPAAHSDSDYPTRPVTLIVPYAAGGVADVGMRIICDRLSDRLGQQFVVENRPGAGGVVAAQAGAGAAPDGYTLLMTGNNTAIAAVAVQVAALQRAHRFRTRYRPPPSSISLIVTRAGSPLKTVQDIIDAARKNPGQAQYRHHHSRQHAKSRRGYCSSARPASMRRSCRSAPRPTWRARCCAAMSTSPSSSMPRSTASSLDKKIVALASTGPQRTAYLPDVPTAIESGLKDFEVQSWNGLSVPAATPPSVVATLNAAMKDDHSDTRRSGPSETDGHGDALEHAGRHDRAPEGRYRQMGRGDRKGRHPQAGLNRIEAPRRTAAKRLSKGQDQITGKSPKGLFHDRFHHFACRPRRPRPAATRQDHLARARRRRRRRTVSRIPPVRSAGASTMAG